jgi:monofunctional biosynthetic peptidoglycan transglycosylase
MGPSPPTIQKTQEGQKLVRTLAVLLFAGSFPQHPPAQEPATRTVVDFALPESARWTIVNDGVMGGRSSSDVEMTGDNTALFSGFLSLENNGGFASVRGSFPTLDLSAYDGVTLRVRGDGRNYQLRFRTNRFFDGVAHGTEFETKAGEWTEVSIPFNRFQPTFRGYRPRGAGPLDPSRIQQITFLIGDKIEAPFQLEIAWVKAYATFAESDAPDR